jgi:large conductance mechanosensitive channel
MRGNVVDMAVGVVIGAAFRQDRPSFTSDLLMPPIGVFTGGMDFSALALTLKGRSMAPPR